MIRRKVFAISALILAVVASPSLWAQQFARPDATLDPGSPGNWTVVNAATHHDAVNDDATLPASDSDYIDSTNGNNSTVILGLSNVGDPGTYADNHVLRYRCQSTAGGGAKERCNAALYDGATLIYDTGNVNANVGAFALHEFTIPDASASGVPDYTNLSVQLTSSSLAGGESIQISSVELQVPDAAATAPTVTSPTSANVTHDSATLGGTMTDTGGGTVTDCGVEWGTTPGGPYPNSQSWDTGGACSVGVPFIASVTGLTPSTPYYFRAWADNGTQGFSGEATFTTTAAAVAPTVTADPVADITQNSATLGGNVTADGGAPVTDRGIVWNTTSPAESGGTVVPMGSGTGSFFNTVSGLPAGTLIIFKAYATNSAGTSYSTPESSFSTLAGLATVATRPVENITATTADLGGDVTSNGGTAVTERGIVWNTTTPPETGGTVVPMGSGTGPFIGLVDSLPTDTLVYFRAYAINSSGTAYSDIQSFTPSESMTIIRVSGKSMVISWVPGSGDGSIVVMRELLTTQIHPVDGVDYAGQPDYSLAPETSVGSQNFVVYKGSNTSVWVTGLALDTTYSIAIYDFTGSGASTDYDQLNPLERDQATTNVSEHNRDNRVNCQDCHDVHGGFMPRNDDLKTVCSVCHGPGGPAQAKQEFDNHLTPTKNPAVDSVDCGRCHEVHKQNAFNTTQSLHSIDLVTRVNKSYLRANVDKYITTAATPAYLHTDQPRRVDPHPDAPQAANNPDRAVEGGDDSTARGYCQVCHTLTANHRSSNTAGSDQCHDGGSGNCGPAETHCGACHEHNNRFAPVGDCTQCHDSPRGGIPRPIITTQYDRLSKHIGSSSTVTQQDCEVCHNQSTHNQAANPDGQIVRLWDLDDGVTFYSQLTKAAPPTDTGEGERFEGNCLSCHDDGVASSLPADSGPPTAGQTQTSPFTNSGSPPVIDPTLWSNALHNRPTATVGSTAPVTCVGNGSNGCHGSGHGSDQLDLLAPADNSGVANHATDFCLNCHDGTLPPAPDVYAQFTVGPDQRYTGGNSYNTVNKRHDVLETVEGDQTYSSSAVTCKNCHNPHAENVNGSPYFLSNPDDKTTSVGTYNPLNSYTGDSPTFTYSDTPGTDLDPTNPRGYTHTGVPGSFVPISPAPPQIVEPDYVQFCLTCHDGTAPPGVTLPPGAAGLINIAVAYTTDQHGAGPGSDNLQRGWMKFPWATPQMDDPASPIQPTPYAALPCTLCHDHHGAQNIYNLKSSVTVAGEVMNVGATNAWQGESGPTYFLPGYGTGTQEKFGWGAWCTFCHEVSHQTNDGTGCSSGHTHGGNNF